MLSETCASCFWWNEREKFCGLDGLDAFESDTCDLWDLNLEKVDDFSEYMTGEDR